MKTTLTHKLSTLTPIRVFIWLEAACLLGFARLLVWALPFKYWVKLIGTPMSSRSDYQQVHIKPEKLLNIQWAIKSAAYRVPWQAVCLPQAMTAKWMLSFRGQKSKLLLGLRADPQKNNKLAAHAWLECGADIIVGEVDEKYSKVTHFI